MFQEFQISVTPLGEDDYLVRTERVAPGVPLAEEQVHWPVETWLQQAQRLMNDPLLHLFEDHRTLSLQKEQSENHIHQSSLNLVTLGQQLHDALFWGSLRDSWIAAQGIAQNQNSVLRLRLGLKDINLSRLPWEVLHTSENQGYSLDSRPLTSGTDITFSRYQLNAFLSNHNLSFKSAKEGPLKILMVIAAPNDQESLELKQEAIHLQAELQEYSSQDKPAIELNFLEQPGREELTQALEQGQYQIFHYAGHSDLGYSGGDIYLVSRTTGLTETLYGDDLAGLLTNNGIKLAFFNSCHGADTAFVENGDIDQKNNLAQALVKRGVPAVLAMAARIPDQVALTLTRLLYRNINQGYPIDFSLSRTRQGLISAYGSNQLYWALPVLYLHPDFDGTLTEHRQDNQYGRRLLDLSDLTPNPLTEEEEALLLTSSTFTSDSWLDEQEELMKSKVEANGNESSDYDNKEEEDDDADFIKDVLTGLVQTDSQLVAVSSLSQQSAELVDAESKNIPQEVSAKDKGQLTYLSQLQKFIREFKPFEVKVIGIISILAIALLGLFFYNRKSAFPDLFSTPRNSTPPNPSVEPISKSVNLEEVTTPIVTSIAIEEFNQGNIEIGQPAVEALLDRGALPQAEAALKGVPIEHLDDPHISFLRGRLAWQFVQAGNQNYDLLDARRYWETTAKQQESITYLNALGFAYYAEGNFNRANQAWYDAISLVEKQPKLPQEALNTYAGLALGLRQLAQNKSGEQKTILLNKALKLRQQVMSQDPVNFQADSLTKNWMWSEEAIKDWKSLLPTQSIPK